MISFLSDVSLTVCFSHNPPCFPSFPAVWAWGSAGWGSVSECTTGTGCSGTERKERRRSEENLRFAEMMPQVPPAPWKRYGRFPAALWSTRPGDGPQTSSHGRPRQLGAEFWCPGMWRCRRGLHASSGSLDWSPRWIWTGSFHGGRACCRLHQGDLEKGIKSNFLTLSWERDAGGKGGVAPLCFLWHCKYMHLCVYTWNFARLLVDCWTELPYGINKVVPDKLNLSSTGILPHGGAKLHQIVTMSFYLFLLCCHRWCHLSQHSSSNISPHWLIPSLALEAISLEAIRATKQYSHPQSPLLVSRLHHLHSRLPNEPKKPSHVSHAEGEKQSVCRCIPSDETWQKVSIRKNTSEQNNATKVLSGFFFLMRQPSQVRGICHRAQTQFHFSPECMSPPVIEFTKNPKQLNSRWRKMESSVE